MANQDISSIHDQTDGDNAPEIAGVAPPQAEQPKERGYPLPATGLPGKEWRYLLASLALIGVLAVVFNGLFPQMRARMLSDDIYHHLVVAREMIETGDYLPDSDDWFLAPAARPHVYPPLFHWMLVGAHKATGASLESICLGLQQVLFPLAMLSFLLLARAVLSARGAFLALLIVGTTFPFPARTHLAIPEAFELVLIPLILWGYVRRKEWVSGLAIAVAVMLHSATPFVLVTALVVHQILARRRGDAEERRRIWPLLLGILPGLALQAWFVFLNYGVPHVATDKLRPRIWWILKAYFNPLFGLRSIVVPLFLGLWGFWKLRDQPHVRLWMTIVIALCTVLVTYSARFSSYALIPLSLTSALLLDLWLQRGVRRAVVLRIVLLLLLNVPASFALFKYNFDYLRPHDVAQEELIREAGQIIPQEKTVCVRELFDAYRVAWYADRSSTILELECGNSEFLYLRGEDTPPEGWVQLVEKESHRLYHRLRP